MLDPALLRTGIIDRKVVSLNHGFEAKAELLKYIQEKWI